MAKFSRFIKEFEKSFAPPVKAEVTGASHPKLHKAVMNLCDQAKIAPPERIIIIEEAFGLPNAMMAHNKNLMLGEELLKTFDYAHTPGIPFGSALLNGTEHEAATISKDLQAIIGHELGHSTRLGKDLAMIYGSAIAAPILLFAGYKIYEHAKHRKEEKGSGHINQHIEITAKEVEKAVGDHIDKSATSEESGFLHGLKKYAIGSAKSIAIYAAASVAAIPVTKFFGRKVEFAADNYAKNLVEDKHMVSALEKIEAKATQIMSEGGVPEFLQKTMRIMDYHPSIASRIANLAAHTL